VSVGSCCSTKVLLREGEVTEGCGQMSDIDCIIGGRGLSGS